MGIAKMLFFVFIGNMLVQHFFGGNANKNDELENPHTAAANEPAGHKLYKGASDHYDLKTDSLNV